MVPLMEDSTAPAEPVEVNSTQQGFLRRLYVISTIVLPRPCSNTPLLAFPSTYSIQSLEAKVYNYEISVEEPLPEPPVPINAPAAKSPSLGEVITMSVANFVQGLFRPAQLIEPSIAIHPENPIRAFSWHPYVAKLAIAPQDKSIRIYDLNNGIWSPICLKHEFQRNVFSLAWKPLSGNTLAVGTRHGILIWTLMSKTVVTQSSTQSALSTALGGTTGSSRRWTALGLDGTLSSSSKQVDTDAWCNYLSYQGYSPINALSWSPNGRFLAAGSIHSPQLLIWDVLLETPTPIVQYLPGNVKKVLWSPNDAFVCVLTTSNVFRVFLTRNWSSERWEQLPRAVHSACWAGDGMHLAITVKGECKVYIIRYSPDEAEVRGTLLTVLDMSPYSVSSSTKRGHSFDSSLGSSHSKSRRSRGGIPAEPPKAVFEVSGELKAGSGSGTKSAKVQETDENESYGGALSHVAWDSTSLRLAVALEGTELIAIYQCNSIGYAISFQPLGYLRGPPETEVTGLEFRPNFGRGALLTASFSNGKISFFPLYFIPTANN